MPTSFDDYGTLSPYNDLYQPSIAELARNRGNAADRPGYEHLGNSLGAMFFGGADREARFGKIYNEAASGEVKLQDLMMKARADRDAEIGRQGAIQDALNHNRSDIANIIRNSPNAASYEEALGRHQSNTWGEKAWDVVTGPEGGSADNLELMTRMNAIRNPASAPELNQVSGGVITNKYKTPEHLGALLETPEGRAAVKEREQSAEAHRTQALENTARTNFIEGPQTMSENALTVQRGREGRGAAGSGDLPAADLALIFSDGAGGKDEAAIKDFKIWMTDNNLSNERKAIGRYLKEQRAKEPVEPAVTTPEEQPSGLKSLFNRVVSPEMQKTLFGGLGTDVARAVGAGGGKPAPFPEGTKGTMNGKRYIVKNGQLVPLNEGPGVSATVTHETHTIPNRKRMGPE